MMRWRKELLKRIGSDIHDDSDDSRGDAGGLNGSDDDGDTNGSMGGDTSGSMDGDDSDSRLSTIDKLLRDRVLWLHALSPHEYVILLGDDIHTFITRQ